MLLSEAAVCASLRFAAARLPGFFAAARRR
jgi:hypothetical protein